VLGAALLAVALGGSASTSHAKPSAVHQAAGNSANVRVPRVVGYRMDLATRTLHNAGLRVNEECSGIFGCIIKSRWWVCTQRPRAGRYVPRYSVVVIYAERRGEC
jgi:beta-lactam-binding protein with PASTA domain